MAYNRSFRFYGVGVGPNTVEITAKFNGAQVYSGPVFTVSDSAFATSSLQELSQIMFTIEDSAEYNTDFSGVVPLEITVTQGNMVAFNDVQANYWGTTPNPVFSPEQYAVLNDPDATIDQVTPILISTANPPFSPDEEILLATLMQQFPASAVELNNLREAHNVAYSTHLANSWQDCFDPIPNPNPDYPWNIHSGTTVVCELEILSFA
jgi:hypothetical protein